MHLCGAKLNEVVFGNKISSIEECAFSDGIVGTSDLTLPSSLTSLSSQVFENCNFENVYWNCPITVIPSSTFANSKLKTISFGDVAIIEISTGAFSGCDKLTQVNIKNWGNVIKFGNNAFYNCSSLTATIVITINTIYDAETTFYNCGANLEFKNGEGT